MVLDDEISVRERFLRDGFVVLHDVLSTGEVATIRSLAKADRDRTGRREMYASDFFKDEMLPVLPAHPVIVRALRDVLGPDPWFYPNATVRQDWRVAWHRDAGFAQLDRADPQPRYVQIGVYLQSNGDGNGGGLDVAVGSHRAHEEVAAWREGGCSGAVTLETRAGDAVLWDGRLIHRSSVAARDVTDTRMAVFWTCAHAAVDPAHFLRHLAGRSAPDEPEHMRARYADIAALRSAELVDARVRAVWADAGLCFAARG